jgi:hypothetical protein
MIELFINLFIGTPTGARIGQVKTILSRGAMIEDLVILMAFTLVISIGGVVLQLGAEHPLGLKAGVKSV